MANLFVRSLSTVAAIAATLAIASAASAQDAPNAQSADVPTALDEIFYGNSGPYNYNRTLWRNIDFILGIGGYPEREVSRDGEAIHRATYYLLEQQTTQDPTIRVPDLFNPYNTSVQFLPTTQTSGRVSGSEFVFEPISTP